MATIRLRKREYSIVAANTTTNASERLAGGVVARASTKAVCVTELDKWCILERRTQRRLVVPCCLAGYWVPHPCVALKDDSPGTLFIFFFTAAAEKKRETACLILRGCRDVESGERAFVVGRDFC
jgi:hypothetical protein